MSQTVGVDGKSWRQQMSRTLLRMVALTVVLGSITACSYEYFVQPQSPPPEVINSPLIDNRWRIVEMLYQGEPVRFETFGSIHITFHHSGGLAINFERCPGGGYRVTYQNGQRYQLSRGMFASADCAEMVYDDPTFDCASLAGSGADKETCKEAINAQFGAFASALKATHQYLLGNGELLLRNEDTEIRLVLDNP